MNSAVWQPCLQLLPGSVRPRCIDLPGYAGNAAVTAATLDDYVEYLVQKIDGPVILLGWSLGGLVSLRLAQRYPHKVSALLQVATSPKFVQDRSWQYGIEAGVFEQFAASLEQDPARTIRRFLALQVRGTDTSMQTVRELQHVIEARGLPGLETLQTGLDILSSSDLRELVPQLNCPLTWLLGDKDALVPVELAQALQQMCPRADIRILEGAGHAPFISQPQAFVDELLQASERI